MTTKSVSFLFLIERNCRSMVESGEVNREQAISQIVQLNGIAQRDPLSLNNSDAPRASLISVAFDGGNFIAWSRQIRMALGAKLKLARVHKWLATTTRSWIYRLVTLGEMRPDGGMLNPQFHGG